MAVFLGWESDDENRPHELLPGPASAARASALIKEATGVDALHD
jgi:hypothetical protein